MAKKDCMQVDGKELGRFKIGSRANYLLPYPPYEIGGFKVYILPMGQDKAAIIYKKNGKYYAEMQKEEGNAT